MTTSRRISNGVDKKLIIRKINLISKDLKALKPISRLGQEKYLKSPIWEVQTERYLERIIGRIIDINYHLIVETDNPPPSNYFQSFVELGKLKILPLKFSQQLAPLAGLRNRLVHEYNALDEKKIYQATIKAMKQIPKYLRIIDKFINQNKRKKLL